MKKISYTKTMDGLEESYIFSWRYVNEALVFPVFVLLSSIALVTIYAVIAIMLGLNEEPENYLVTTVSIAAAASLPMTIVAFYREHKNYVGQLMLRSFASTDPLTGILNRRGFSDAVSDECVRMSRTGHIAAIILFDIDQFKILNDTYGHVVGDQVLRAIAAVAHFELRGPFDRLGRWGGEEFVILLHDVTLEQTYGVAERLRQQIEQHLRYHDKFMVGVTASFGTSQLSANCLFEDALIRADLAMYQAKARGRNRVVTNSQMVGGVLSARGASRLARAAPTGVSARRVDG